MGYYSTMSLDLYLDKVEEFKGLLAEVKLKIASGIAEDWEQELDMLYLDEDDYLTCEETYAKWYYDSKWILKLAPFVQEGEIEFVGEEGEHYGYLFENHQVYDLIYEKRKGELLTTTVLDDFV